MWIVPLGRVTCRPTPSVPGAGRPAGPQTASQVGTSLYALHASQGTSTLCRSHELYYLTAGHVYTVYCTELTVLPHRWARVHSSCTVLPHRWARVLSSCIVLPHRWAQGQSSCSRLPHRWARVQSSCTVLPHRWARVQLSCFQVLPHRWAHVQRSCSHVLSHRWACVQRSCFHVLTGGHVRRACATWQKDLIRIRIPLLSVIVMRIRSLLRYYFF